MRIDSFSVTNFMGFEQFESTLDPNFTLLVGENGTGKTSVVEALRFVLFEAIRLTGVDMPLPPLDVFFRKVARKNGARWSFEKSEFLKLKAEGSFQGLPFELEITRPGVSRVDGLGATPTLLLGLNEDTSPVILKFGYEGLGKFESDWKKIMSSKLSRRQGYDHWDDAGRSISETINWLGKQEAIFFQEDVEPEHYRVVKAAICQAMPGAKEVWFNPKVGEPCVRWEDDTVTMFSNLSAGQKSILALVGDIARRCSLLNPHIGEDVIKETPGVVLIDEIDMHLHPRWQRRIVGDLKRIFPKVQFVATSHSPFIIQSLEPGELRVLGGESTPADYGEQGIEDITEHVMGVDQPHRSERYGNMLSAAEEYFRLLHADGTPEDKLEAARERVLQQSIDFPGDPVIASMLKRREVRTEAAEAK